MSDLIPTEVAISAIIKKAERVNDVARQMSLEIEDLSRMIQMIPQVDEEQLKKLQNANRLGSGLFSLDAQGTGQVADSWVALGVRSGLAHISDPESSYRDLFE